MCRICGIIGLEDKSLLKRMCDVISHRGPDDSGIFMSAVVILVGSVSSVKTGVSILNIRKKVK